MKENLMLKILTSIPLILFLLYFIPFLGICLLIIRLCISRKSNITTCSILVLVGIIAAVFKHIINILSKIIKNDKIIDFTNYFTDNTELTNNILKFGKLCITVGIIFIVLSIIFKKILDKSVDSVKKYIEKEEEKSYKIQKENNLIMQEKREKAKYTRNIVCKHCGASNLVSEKTDKCKYCRQPLQ